MLTKEELQAIKELKDICENIDNCQLKLNFDMLENRTGKTREDYFHYDEGKLVGFLGSYGFGNKVEICGMVHPNFRRRGIFTKLLTECITDLKTRNVNTVLLNAPTDSQSAREFLRSISCSFSMSEYQMKWQKTELFLDTSVSLRPSVSLEDFEAEVQLDILAFGLEEHEAREYNKQVKEFNTEQQYIIETCGKTAGKMRVAEDNGEAWIYGFAIFPELQGKGIGKMALLKLVTMESHKGLDIFLEVEAKNAHALRLYQSCGFRSYHSQDYYEYQN